MKLHHYQTYVQWTGNTGQGTAHYQAYSRNHNISVLGKNMVIPASSDVAFRGDASRYSPEELFLASLSACHMLWYLHLCATHNICVLAYEDQAISTMEERADGAGQFTSVTLKPVVTISDASKTALAETLHQEANQKCFIANSCNFMIHHEAVIQWEGEMVKFKS